MSFWKRSKGKTAYIELPELGVILGKIAATAFNWKVKFNQPVKNLFCGRELKNSFGSRGSEAES